MESGLDPGTSPGYGVFNLSGIHPLMANLSLTWAVDNVFDKTWASHVSKADALGQEFFCAFLQGLTNMTRMGTR